jgi:hypothetical protein
VYANQKKEKEKAQNMHMQLAMWFGLQVLQVSTKYKYAKSSFTCVKKNTLKTFTKPHERV